VYVFKMSELQLEGFGYDIKNTVSIVLCESASSLWLPYEFIDMEPVTRVFLYGEHSAGTRSLLAAENWTMALCMAGSSMARTWSILASMMRHLVGPVFLVMAPDVLMPAGFVPHIGQCTVIMFRFISESITVPVHVGTVFYPVGIQAGQIVALQRNLWKSMALRTSDTNLGLIVQETRPQGLGLVSSVLEGGVVTLSWYRPLDSDALVLVERRNLLALWLGAISERIIMLLKS
jgi:hypothetical protein